MVQGTVERSVAVGVEAMPDVPSAAGLDRAHTGQSGETASLRKRPGPDQDTQAYAAVMTPTPRMALNTT
ncbi:hypothetical protein GCM10009736_09030 [Actinomadura bangladeshensis]